MTLTPLEEKFLAVANQIMRQPHKLCHCPPSMDGTVKHGGFCQIDRLARAICDAEAKHEERDTEKDTGAHDECCQALQLIAAPMRPDGTWNRDRESCRQLAEEALKSTSPVRNN